MVLTGKGSYTGKRNETFVIEPIDLHTSSFNIHVEDVKYNGKAQKPKVTVMFTAPSNKEIKLVKGKDYQVEYYDHTGSPTQDTEGYVKITGLGNYCGTIGDAGEETCKFRMIHNRLASEFQISGIHNCVYNGEEQTFRNADGDCTLSVTCKGKTLVEGTDFKVSYLDHVNVGKATVLIQGIGDYAGTAKKYFRIKPADFLAAYQSGDLYIDYYEDGGLPNYITNQLWYLLEENVSLRYRYSYLEPGRDYRIVMKNFNKTGPGKICFVGKGNFKGTVVILENLYAEACNIGNYRVKINQNQTIYYTGKAIKPLVQLNEYAYDIPSDFYQTKVEKGINAGNYSYEITLNEKLFDTRDSYIKTKKGTYEIKPRNIEETKISPIAAQTYQGVAVTPKVSIKFGSLKLKQGVDYTVSYQNNHARTCDSSESAYVVIKGIGNFSGETRTSFVIK
ncbi:MAG: hypothetical protein GX567_14570 [Clostridia bacterium]|nr:hypothetical protein [Clostridia bacterium]